MSTAPFQGDEISHIAALLEHCALFASLSKEMRTALVVGCRLIHLAPGELLCEEGTPGKELFILSSGLLEVYSTVSGNEVVFHRIDTRGDHVGEQALQPGEGRLRSASIRASASTVVVAVHQHQYQVAADLDPNIAQIVDAQGAYQARERTLSELSIMYRAMAVFDEEGFGEEVRAESGEPVFRQGDPADRVYLIMRGTARVLQHDESGKTTMDIVLHAGQMFGEQAVMKNIDRTATVTAEETLDLLSFQRDRFISAVAESPELYQYMMALRRVYSIRSHGAVQYDGQQSDQNAIVTMLQIDSTHQVVARLLVDKQHYTARRQGPEGPLGGQRYEYAEPRRQTWRVLIVSGGCLQQIEAQGPWHELGQVQKMLESGERIEIARLQDFTLHGSLLHGRSQDPDPVLCHCLNLRRSEVEQAIERGCRTVASIGTELGAGRVCGGCTVALAEMVGSGGAPMCMLSSLSVGHAAQAVRFAPLDGQALTPSRPGQHVVVSAEIDGERVARAYTLTSPDTQTQYREIIVKKETHGLFSRWLCDAPVGTKVEVSAPQGHFFIEPDETHDVVCFVAGIGMTPSLAMARSCSAHGTGRRLYIDYTTGFPRDRVAADELSALAEQPSIEITLRYSSRGERLSPVAVQALAGRYPRAHFYTCGPAPFQAMIVHALSAAGVEAERVHVESFTTPQGSAAVTPRSWVDWVGSAAAIAAALAYVLQDALDWSPAALTILQQQQRYQIASGLLLLTFLVLQWWLPTNRLRGETALATRLIPTTAGSAGLRRSSSPCIPSRSATG